LIVGYRNERSTGKAADHIRQPRQIEPAVHRGNERHAKPVEQWQMQPVDMRMDHVKIAGMLRDRFEQDRQCRYRVRAGTSKAERSRPDGIEVRACFRTTALRTA